MEYTGKKRNPIISSVLILLMLLSNPPAKASSFKPVASNFSTKEYGNDAGIQNWGIDQGKNGEMYFANNKGMLVFDGFHWNLYPLPDHSIIRTVHVDGDSIFAGSYEEFGYFKKDSFGDFKYHSLSAKLKNVDMKNEEVWNIVKSGKNIYFQTFTSAFCYDGKKVSLINSKIRPLYFHNVNGKIYAPVIDDGYYMFDGKHYRKLFDKSVFGNDNVVAAISIMGGGEKAILCTENNGLFLMQGGKISKFSTTIDGRLKSSRINRATITQDNILVIGTILDGIYAIDMQGRLQWHYNIESGMLSNSVLRLFCDRDNNVWAALDNGIALVHTGSPFSIMIPERGEPMLGMIYDINIIGNNMLIATNQGLYNYDLGNGSIRLISDTEGQNWHVSIFDNQIFVGNNRHTITKTANSQFRPINGTSSSSTCMKKCTINGQEILIEATYAKMRIYKRTNGEWELSGEVDGFIAPLKQIEVDHSGTIWAANMNRGIYRIELSQDLKKVAKAEVIKNHEKSSASLNYVMKIRGRIVFSDNQRLYTYDDMKQQIIPYTILNNGLVTTTDIHSAIAIDDHTFWLSGKFGYTLVRYEENRFKTIKYIPISFFGLQNNESNDKVFRHGSDTYFNMNNGIAQFRLYGKYPNRTPALELTSVSTTDDNGVIQLPISPDTNHDTKNGISLQYSFPKYGSDTYLFKFTLEGAGNTVTIVRTTPDVQFHDLKFGNYKLTVVATNATGIMTSRSEYCFSVPKPFYLSAWAIAFYLIIAGASFYFISKWRTDKALEKKRKEYEFEKNKQDIKMLEQEKLIAQQQQQLLESELTAKSKEIASLSLDAAAKSQAIENLKKSMYTQKLKGSLSQKDMDSMLKQIETGTGNPEFWKIYQKNFDLIHENFFRNLRQRYPSLTAGDLKFCALLRLNLTTKDIAKFTNLTIRGVEAARYRIRKKLNLPEKASLIEFLIDFK